MWAVVGNIVTIADEVFNQFCFEFKSSMIATDMNSHKRILSRTLEILAQPSRQRETRPADFSTKRVLITLAGGIT
jgi:hypothetical protein